MALADAAGPVGLLLVFAGMVIFGQSRDAITVTIFGLVLGAVGAVLMFLAR